MKQKEKKARNRRTKYELSVSNCRETKRSPQHCGRDRRGQETGRQVHLDGIGYFRRCLTSTEPVTIDTKRKATKVKLKAIQFRADQTLKNEFGILKVKSLKGGLDFSQLTNEEIDRKLTKYFQTHPFMRRCDFQDLCRMTRSTAMRHIRRLRDEGKLKNEGGVMQPIYVPGNGYYTNNKHVTD